MLSAPHDESPPIVTGSQRKVLYSPRKGKSTPIPVVGLAVLVLSAGVAWFMVGSGSQGPNKWVNRLPEVALDQLSKRATSLVAGCVEAIQLNPEDAEGWGLLGRVYLAHQFAGPASECFQVAWELDQDNFKWPYSLVMAEPGSEEAIDYCRQAIELCPHEGIEIRCRLAELYFGSGDLAKSREALETVIEIVPDYPRANMMLAQIYLQNGQIQKGIQQAELVLQSQPDRREALRFLSQAHFRLGNSEKSSEYAIQSDKPGAFDPAWDDLLYQEAMSLRRDVNRIVQEAMRLPASRVEQKLKILREAVAEEPHEPNWHGFLGQTLLKSRQYSEAESVLKNGIGLHPLSASLHYSLGLVFLNQKKLNLAIKSLQEAVKVKPDFDKALTDLGIAFRENQQADQAIQSLQKAISIFPGNFRAQLNLGVTCEMAGDLSGAAQAYRQCLALDPNSGDVHLLLGKVLLQSVETQREAEMHLEKAKELNLGINGIQK